MNAACSADKQIAAMQAGEVVRAPRVRGRPQVFQSGDTVNTCSGTMVATNRAVPGRCWAIDGVSAPSTAEKS